MNKVNNIPHHDICKYMKPSIMTPTTKCRIQKKKLQFFGFLPQQKSMSFQNFLIHKDLDNLRKRKISIKIPKISLFLASCAKHYQEWLNVRILVRKPKLHYLKIFYADIFTRKVDMQFLVKFFFRVNRVEKIHKSKSYLCIQKGNISQEIFFSNLYYLLVYDFFYYYLK